MLTSSIRKDLPREFYGLAQIPRHICRLGWCLHLCGATLCKAEMKVILLLILSKFSFSSHQHAIIPHSSGWLCILGTVLSSILEECLDIQALSNFCEEIKTILTLFWQINCIRTCIMQAFFESNAWSFISVIVQWDYQFIALCSTCCNYTNTQAHYLSFSLFPDTVW